MPTANRLVRQPGRGRDAQPKGRPIPGNVFDDRMRHGPGCNRCLNVCADCLGVRFLATAIYVRPQRAFSRHRGIYRSDVRLLLAWTGAPPPDGSSNPSPTTRRQDHVILIVPMSSDRLFLEGLLASIAPLRFTGTINLSCSSAWTTPNRTFLLCQEEDISILP